MSARESPERRALLQRLALGLSLGAVLAEQRVAPAAAPALLSEQDPAAKAVQYVEDAKRAKGAESGADCSSCSLYGSTGPDRGSCTLFPGKLVKSAGWCSKWSGL
ncbi:MAG TPA: high-potential iron-sulfur protein [Steroidobacteraceae bacterium]|jgi:hypothetical protein